MKMFPAELFLPLIPKGFCYGDSLFFDFLFH